MRVGSEIWGDKAKLKATFAALTRTGMGPAFGSRNIAWYQLHQCAAVDVLTERLVGARVLTGDLDTAFRPMRAEVRVRANHVQGRMEGEKAWRDLGLTPACVWSLADKRCRV